MKLNRPTTLRKRGTVLMTVLILLTIGSIIAVGLCQYMFSMIRLEERRADGLKAFYIAESGINRVVDFFNHPEQYPDSGSSGSDLAMAETPMPGMTLAGLGAFTQKSATTAEPIGSSSFLIASASPSGGDSQVANEDRLFFYDESTGTFPNLETQLQQGDVTIDNTVYPSFNGNQGGLFGHVEDIVMTPPANGDPANCFARMRSTGVTRTGIRKTVSVFLFAGNPAASSPAALISKKNAAFSGNVAVQWGEVWVKEIGELPNWSKWGNYIDPLDNEWTFIKTNEYFKQGTNKYLDGSKNGADALITDPNNVRYLNPCAPTAELDEYDGRILQHQNLQFPEFDYEDYKLLALRRGDYYSTGAGGKLYRRDGSLVADIHAELWSADPSSTEKRFVFIDTIDKQPPRADGSNLTDLPLAGNSPHSKGLYYINANLDAKGMGNPPTLAVKDPDGNAVQLSKVWHVGIIYISGDLDGVGNSRVFGSVISERGITESGTPSVYYDFKLKEATFMPLNSLVSVRLYAIN